VTRRRLFALALGLLPLVLVLAVALARRRTAEGPRPSVLLVTLDTLRADRVGAWGGPPGLTPALDALAARGLVFEEALASAPLTLPSHATLFTGLEPPRHGVRDNGTYVVPADLETLTTRLKAAGYETGAFVGAYVLDRRFGLARGFDHYDDRIARRESGASVLESERPGAEVVSQALAWLAGRKGRFFLWAHLYDAHAPYAPPPPFRDAHSGRPYDGEVASVDDCVRRLVEAARAAAAARGEGEPLVVVVADHGEALGEHGEETHGLFVYQGTLRIPLLLAGPRVPRGQRHAGLARTADVLPTLLGRLGLASPAGLDGVDLLADGRRERDEAYAETEYPASFGWSPLRSVRVGGLKLIDAPRPELYDLAADPRETRDLAAERPDAVERLRQALRGASGRERAPSLARLDPASAERLRALGYVSGEAAAREARGDRPDPKDRLEAYRAFEAALAAESRGDRTAAVAGLGRLVASEPANAVFRRALVSALRRAGRPAEAVAALGVPGSERGDAAAWQERAAALEAAGRRREAEESARTAVRLDPARPEAHNQLGVLLASRGQAREALAHFETASELDPTDASAWTNRGNARRELGLPEEARRDYDQAAELAPRDPDPLNGLGVLAVMAGRPLEAAALFRRALELDPDLAEARLNLAVALVQEGHAAEALIELDRLPPATPPEIARRAAGLRRDLAR